MAVLWIVEGNDACVEPGLAFGTLGDGGWREVGKIRGGRFGLDRAGLLWRDLCVGKGSLSDVICFGWQDEETRSLQGRSAFWEEQMGYWDLVEMSSARKYQIYINGVYMSKLADTLSASLFPFLEAGNYKIDIYIYIYVCV